jgi:predicted SprT family Zn-dependent metalloprotease
MMSFSSGHHVANRSPRARLAHVHALAQDLLYRHDLSDWSFGFNRRKTEMGVCLYDPRRIELSVYFVALNDDETILDTLLHEIAHALTGPGHGHDHLWKCICHRVGARPERLSYEARMPEGRWQAVCAGCGMLHHKHRRPKRMIGWYCRSCGRDRGKLIWSRAEPSLAG